METNQQFAEHNKLFKTACDLAGVKPTKRQASNFKRGYGQAAGKLKEAAQAIVEREALK